MVKEAGIDQHATGRSQTSALLNKNTLFCEYQGHISAYVAKK